VANFSSDPATAAIAGWAGAELLITNVQERGQTPFLRLEPWEARVYRRVTAPRSA